MRSLIPKLLKEKHMSVNALSKATGLSRTTLTPLARDSEIPNKTRIETLETIAKALRLTVFELLDSSLSITDVQIFPILHAKKVALLEGESNVFGTSKKTVSMGTISCEIQGFTEPLWFAYDFESVGGLYIDLLSSYDLLLLSTQSEQNWVMPKNTFTAQMNCLNIRPSFMNELNANSLVSFLKTLSLNADLLEVSSEIRDEKDLYGLQLSSQTDLVVLSSTDRLDPEITVQNTQSNTVVAYMSALAHPIQRGTDITRKFK